MEELARILTSYISYAAEILAALVIGIALIRSMVQYAKSFKVNSNVESKQNLRIEFGSSLAIALEFLLGADILATAVAPTWDEIGKLAAIAILRTALNFILERELKIIESESSEKNKIS